MMVIGGNGALYIARGNECHHLIRPTSENNQIGRRIGDLCYGSLIGASKMLQERQCKVCSKYYYHEDEVDDVGLSGRKPKGVKTRGDCPNCVDPYAIAGMSHKKETILGFLRDYLENSGIDVEGIENDSLVTMLYQFPLAEQFYHSNGNYITFNVPPGIKFDGKYGTFTIGSTVNETVREIMCDRCNCTVGYESYIALRFFMGFVPKQCRKCDAKLYVKAPIRDVSGLNRNGAILKLNSFASLAKRFNVSRSDYRRHIVTEAVPSLSVGTVIKNLEIVEAYWDTKTEGPRYKLKCVSCSTRFNCTQKSVSRLDHFCSK